MSQLGKLLKQLRQDLDRSRLWVERQSRQRHPNDKERHISHSYLRQLEEGMRQYPNPLKLQTLAELYQAEYGQLMAVAGYLDPPSATPPSSSTLPSSEPDAAQAARKWLEANGVNFDYFLRGLTGLSKDSLALVSRMVATWSIKERQIQNADAHADRQTTADEGV